MGFIVDPLKNNPPLCVYPYGVKFLQLSFFLLKLIRGGNQQILNPPRCIDITQAAKRFFL
jgi:hypothetical protein